MALQIHKKGQGYWTRMMTAIAAGLLVVMGGVWLSDTLRGVRIGNLEPIYVQAGAFVLVVAVFGFLGYYLIGCKDRFVDFLIATEGEMKKVFTGYLRSWGDLDISQIQFNVVDRETLLDAQANPEKHTDLLVRVAGYSAYFVDLSKGLQNSIIKRNELRFS